ncbi:hypothetical protein, partial [Rossellomorea marisflavi]|uniref:hypothetical protein n=1 Tax=Rossellomorea marisflavi TaxID=189381 RepID=UPI003D2EAAAD
SVPFRCGGSLSAGRSVEPPRACGVSPVRLTAGVDPPPLQGNLGCSHHPVKDRWICISIFFMKG